MRMGFQQSYATPNNAVCQLAGVSGGASPRAIAKGPFGEGGFAAVGVIPGTGSCLVVTDTTITLNAESTAGLLYMIEEKKLARDLYDVFFEQTDTIIFDRISNAEQRHLDSLLNVAQQAGIDTSSVNTTAGVFTNPVLQTLYDSLLATGDDSLVSALQAAITIEQTDIADISGFSADPELGILGVVYARLAQASTNHLAAFTQQLDII